MVVVVGHPTGGNERSKSVAIQRRFNAANVISEGRILETYAKRELPNYQVGKRDDIVSLRSDEADLRDALVLGILTTWLKTAFQVRFWG